MAINMKPAARAMRVQQQVAPPERIALTLDDIAMALELIEQHLSEMKMRPR